jgi:uracil-DNA glycosylase
MQHRKIFPPQHQVMRAFDLCTLDKMTVVIIGQDPYHGAGQVGLISLASNNH